MMYDNWGYGHGSNGAGFMFMLLMLIIIIVVIIAVARHLGSAGHVGSMAQADTALNMLRER